ncbi:MAG: hypothetical protein R6V10_10960 [bacterium]
MRIKITASLLLFALLSASYWSSRSEKPEWKIVQLTSCMSGWNTDPQVTDDGRTVYFLSTCNLADMNDDKSPEIFRWREGKIKQLTRQKNCIINDLALAPDNQSLAFSSNCSFSGDNLQPTFDIHVREKDGDIRAITNGNGIPSRNPAWSPDSRRMAFESRADLKKKENLDYSNEIFLAELSASTVSIKQISNTRPPGGCEEPGLTTTSIICRCNDDIPGTDKPEEMSDLTMTRDGRTVGGNPDKNWEIFKFSFSGEPRQLTYSQGCSNGAPVVSPQGKVVSFTSPCKLKPEKTDMPLSSFELYLLAPDVTRPFPGHDFPVRSMAWSGDGNLLALSTPLGTREFNKENNIEISTLEMPKNFYEKKETAFDKETPAQYLKPVTDFNYGTSELPDVNRDGKVIVFVSNANYKDGNQDGSREIFMAVRQNKYREIMEGPEETGQGNTVSGEE